jgi:hypothetical protein
MRSMCCKKSRHGRSEIVNTDQGSQFPAYELCRQLRKKAVNSAWMVEGPGGIMYSLRDYGNL